MQGFENQRKAEVKRIRNLLFFYDLLVLGYERELMKSESEHTIYTMSM